MTLQTSRLVHPTDSRGTATAHHDIAVGSSLLGISAIVVGAANYGYSMVLVWLLYVTVYPAFATGQAILLTVATTASAGIPWVLAREIAVASDITRRRQAISFAFLAGTGQAVITAALVVPLMSHFGSLHVVLATVLAAVVISEAAIITGYLQGKRHIGTIAVLRVIEVAVKITSGMMLYLFGAGVAGVLAGFCLGSAVTLVYGLHAMRHDLAFHGRSMLDGRLWRDAAGMFGIQTSAAIFLSLDIIIAALITPPGSQLASYQAALTISRIPLYLSVAGALVAFQVLASASREGAVHAIRSSLTLFVTVTIPVVIAIATVPSAVLSFGLPDNYQYVHAVLSATALTGGLFGAINLMKTYFQASQSFVRCSLLLVVASGLQTLLLMVGHSWGGIAGLAWADVAGCAAVVTFLLLLIRTRWPGSLAGLSRTTVIATVLTAPLILLARSPSLWTIYSALIGLVVARTILVNGRVQRGNDRPRILHLAFEDHRQPGSGGGAVRTFEINRRLARTWDVTVVTARYRGARPRVEAGVRYCHIGPPWCGHTAARISYFAAIPFALWLYPSDIVIEDFAAPFSSALVPLFTRRPVVGVCQWLFAREKSRQYWLPFFVCEELGVRLHRRIVAVSGELADRLRRMNGRAWVTVVPNGVVPPAPTTTLVPQDQRSDFVYLGRLEIAQKGIDLLIDAFARIADDSDADLLILGDGVDSRRVRDLVTQHGIDHRVHFLGRVEGQAKRHVLAHARLVCVPSRYETFGMVALEALAAGTAVVGFDIPCLRELVSAECGILVPAFNTDAFLNALRELDRDPQRRQRMGKVGMSRARDYNWDELARHQEDVYREALHASVGAPPAAAEQHQTEELIRDRLDEVLARIISHTPRHLTLIGNYGNGNTGDEAILLGILERIRSRLSVTVLSRNPARIAAWPGMVAVRTISWRTIWTLLRTDTIIIGGGGIFGAGIPRLPSLLPLVALGARLLGKRTALVALGAYDDMPRWVLITLRLLARYSTVVSVRDAASYRSLNHRVLGRTICPVLVADPAVALRPSSAERASELLASAGLNTAHAPLLVSVKPMPDPTARSRVLAALTQTIDWWCDHRRGDVIFLAMSDRGDYGLGQAVTDTTMAQDIITSSRHPRRLHTLGPNLAPRDVKAIFGVADAVVAIRLHAQLFASAMNTPILGITFEQKATSYLLSIGAPLISTHDLHSAALISWLEATTC